MPVCGFDADWCRAGSSLWTGRDQTFDQAGHFDRSPGSRDSVSIGTADMRYDFAALHPYRAACPMATERGPVSSFFLQDLLMKVWQTQSNEGSRDQRKSRS